MINEGAKAKLITFITQDKPNVQVKFVHIMVALKDFVYNDTAYNSLVYSESASFGPFRFNEPEDLNDMIYSTEFYLDRLKMVDAKGKFKGTIQDVMKDDQEDKSKLLTALRKMLIDYKLDGSTEEILIK